MAAGVEVVVTGIGAVTPLGGGVAGFRDAVLEGRSGVVTITEFKNDDMPVHIGGMVRGGFDVTKLLSPEQIPHASRVVQMSLAAAAEALGPDPDAALRDRRRVGVVQGVCSGGLEVLTHELDVLWNQSAGSLSSIAVPQLMDSATSAWIAQKWNITGPAYCVATACATSMDSLGLAVDMIKSGRVDACLAGGGDAAVTRFVMSAFANARALSRNNDNPALASRPFDKERDGFVMGEAAVVLLLERRDRAEKRGAKILARLAGYGATNDAHHLTSPRPDGSGLAAAMKQALEAGGVAPTDVGFVSAHATSTEQGDVAEAAALKAVFGSHVEKLPVGATKSLVGHSLGGAGGVSSMAAILAVTDGILTPCISYQNPDPDCAINVVAGKAQRAKVSYAIANAAGFGGHNSTLLFGAP
ncbi:MAG: beta-ketoacyl-[acyl-carrier-protein] synthase family protein [Myxococcota bacterium]